MLTPAVEASCTKAANFFPEVEDLLAAYKDLERKYRVLEQSCALTVTAACKRKQQGEDNGNE